MTEKGNYPLTRFGDVAREVREAERDPLGNGLESLIGLEHIEPENLHIKEWGSVADGTSFTRVFRKGQVLFGKRRAYQRKVAIAEFDGICSSDIIVMEAIDDMLVPELLPFIVQSEGFFEHALSTSAGSLSPRTKWKHLAEYKFPLPPKDEQHCIAEILWAADDVLEKYYLLLESLISMQWAFYRDAFFDEDWERCKLGDCLRERRETSQFPHLKSIYIGLEHFKTGSWELIGHGDSYKFTSNCSAFKRGNLLYGKLRPNLDKAVIAPFDGVCSTEILVLQANEKTSNEYILHHFHSPKFVRYNTQLSYGTKMPRTSFDILREFEIALPTRNEQDNILEKANQFIETEKQIGMYISEVIIFRKSLIEETIEQAW